MFENETVGPFVVQKLKWGSWPHQAPEVATPLHHQKIWYGKWTLVWKRWIFTSSHPEVFFGNGVLKLCSKFTEKHRWQSATSIKLLSNLIKITLRHGCSPGNLLHLFRTPFPKNTFGRLLVIKSNQLHEIFVPFIGKEIAENLYYKIGLYPYNILLFMNWVQSLYSCPYRKSPDQLTHASLYVCRFKWKHRHQLFTKPNSI